MKKNMPNLGAILQHIASLQAELDALATTLKALKAPAVAGRKAQETLTLRDIQMLSLLGQGLPSKVIAKRLKYREGTVRVYLHALYRKIGVDNKTQAALWFKTHSDT